MTINDFTREVLINEFESNTQFDIDPNCLDSVVNALAPHVGAIRGFSDMDRSMQLSDLLYNYMDGDSEFDDVPRPVLIGAQYIYIKAPEKLSYCIHAAPEIGTVYTGYDAVDLIDVMCNPADLELRMSAETDMLVSQDCQVTMAFITYRIENLLYSEPEKATVTVISVDTYGDYSDAND